MVRKSLQKLQILLKSDRSAAHFTRNPQCVTVLAATYVTQNTKNALLYFRSNGFSITILRATQVHQQYKGKAFVRFNGKSGYTKSAQFYVIRKLPTLLILAGEGR